MHNARWISLPLPHSSPSPSTKAMEQQSPPSSTVAAERYLAIAKRLLATGDFTGSQAFAERALTSDPLLPGADHVLAITAVHLANRGETIIPDPDWYSILDLPSSSSSPLTVALHYRRLALALRPGANSLPFAPAALALVSSAFAVLSDPVKKARFDEAAQQGRASAPPTFWAGCRACCHLHQYGREHLGSTLRCPACARLFLAAEIPVPPPVVPGTDMYYCYWGFFPLGFPGFDHPLAEETVARHAADQPTVRKRKVKTTARKTVGGHSGKKVLGTIIDFDDDHEEEEEEEDGWGAGTCGC